MTLELLQVDRADELPEPWPEEVFATRLESARLTRGYTQEQLARLAFVDVDTIRGYENERRIPRGDTLRLIVKALRVSADWLLGLKGEDLAPE